MFPLPRGVIWLTLSLCLFSQPTTTHTSEGGRVVCYYTNWSVYRPGTAKFSPQNINPYLCTHLIYAFGGFTKDNTLKPFDKYQDIEQGGYAKFTGLKTYNKNLKTLLAIGGWNEASSRFSPLVANAERRAEFVRNILKFLRQNHFDGIDLDWEYPAFREGGKSRDRENYAKFVQELRAEFEKETSKTGRPRLLITMAVPAGVEYIEKGYDIPKLNKYLDWFNILSYDYHSAYEPSVNHHSPLYSLEEESEYNFDSDLNIDHTVKHYIKLGAQRDKLVLGMPTYGRSFTLFNEDSTDIGAPSDGPGEQGDATREKGYLAYYEICQNLKEDSDWTVVQPNPKAMGPYAFKLNQWVGYDDEAIARKKAEYVVEQGLGGIMFWSLDNDDFRGSCTGKPYPIIEAAKEALLESTGFGENEVIDKKLKQPARARSRNKSSSDRNKISNEVKSVRRQNANKRTTTTESSSLFIGGKSTTPPPPTTPDPGSDFKCKDEGFFQHPRDCKKYFWCLDSPNLGLVAHQFTCPSGLYFNPAADSCDFSRNVLCKKSQQATSTSTTTTAKPTTTTSSSRITAATSKNTYFRPSTTTTTTEEPYELEYEDEEETHVKGSEEDPMVIKELIDLIKKVGGIEELEKQLLQNEDGTMVLKNRNERDEKTTANPISKSLYDRVLSRSKSLNALQTRFKSNSFLRASHSPKTQEDYDENGEVLVESKPQDKYSSVIRNSRPGPQNEGLDQLAESEGFLREKPKYVTISRSHQKDEVVDESDNEKEETAEVVTKSSRFDNEKTVTHAYTNIRRSRPSTEKNVEEDYAENVEEEEEERTFDKRPYQSINRSRSNLDVTEAPFEASTAGRRYKVFSRNRVQRPQPDDEEFDDTSNVTVQDLEQIELTTQSSTQPTSRTYAVVGRRTTTTSTSATSTTLTDITNELQTTLSYNDNSNTPSTTASNPTTTSPTIQNTPSLLEISYSQDFDHSTHKPIALSTIESGLDTQEVTATTSQYNNIDDNYNNNNINNNSKQNTDTEEVTVAKTDNEKSSVDLKIDNNDNIKKHIDNIDISSNSSPLKNSIDSSSTSTTTSTPESIFIHKNNGDSAIKDSNIASEFSKSTTTTTSTETPSQSPTNNEFLGTVSSPRPFGFPRRRTRPIITTTATPDNSSQNSEHNHSNSLDQINRSNDNNKFSTKKVSSSFRNKNENTIVSESSSTSAPKVVDGSIFSSFRSSNRKFSSNGNGIPETNNIQNLSPKHAIGMSKVYPGYESEDDEYQEEHLSKQYNWKDNRVPRIKWKQVPLDSSDVSTYKAYKYILNEDYRTLRNNKFEDILDDANEIKSIKKRSADTYSTTKSKSWKDGRNSSIKWKPSSLDSSDISNLKSYRHYLSEDKEYQRKHVEQQKQDQESLKRLSRSIDVEQEVPTYESVIKRKLMSFDDSDGEKNIQKDTNLVQSINEMIEGFNVDVNDSSSGEEEDLRQLTSFKKSPYQYKYSYKTFGNSDQKKKDEPVTIKYKYSGNLSNNDKSNTMEDSVFKITFNNSPQTSYHFSSKQNKKNDIPYITKHHLSLNTFGQQSSVAKEISSNKLSREKQLKNEKSSTEAIAENENILHLLPEKGSGIQNTFKSEIQEQVKMTKMITPIILQSKPDQDTPQAPELKIKTAENSLLKILVEEEHTTKANRKYQFSFSSNQTASRGSYSYDETKKTDQQFSQPQSSVKQDSIENTFLSEENTTISLDEAEYFHDATTSTPKDVKQNDDKTLFVISSTDTNIMDSEISSTEYFKPTTYRGNHVYKNILTTPRSTSLSIKMNHLKSFQVELNRKKSHSAFITSKQDLRLMNDMNTTKKRAMVRLPTTKTPKFEVVDQSNVLEHLTPTVKPEIPSWKSKSRGTFRPRLQDFSSLLSIDNPAKTPENHGSKISRRRGPITETDRGNQLVKNVTRHITKPAEITKPIRKSLITTSTEKYFDTSRRSNIKQSLRVPLRSSPHDPLKNINSSASENRKRTDLRITEIEEKSIFREPNTKIVENNEDLLKQQHISTESTESDVMLPNEETSKDKDQVLINDVFGSSSNHSKLSPIVGEIPLFTRRKYYKYLKDSPTIYVSKSENKDDNKISDSEYRIKEVFDASFVLTTPATELNKLRTQNKSSKHIDFSLEPEHKSSSSKVKINILSQNNLVSVRPSIRKSKSSKISIDDQAFSVESKHEIVNKETHSSFSEDMVTEESSYYDVPENFDFTTISNVGEAFISANEVNELINFGKRGNIKSSENSESESFFIEMNNLLSEGGLTENFSTDPEVIETGDELKKKGILRYKNINNLNRIRSTTSEPITNMESGFLDEEILNDTTTITQVKKLLRPTTVSTEEFGARTTTPTTDIEVRRRTRPTTTTSQEPEIKSTSRAISQAHRIIPIPTVPEELEIKATTNTNAQVDIRTNPTFSSSSSEEPEIGATSELNSNNILEPHEQSTESSLDFNSIKSLRDIENQSSLITERVEAHQEFSKIDNMEVVTSTNNINSDELDTVTEMLEPTQYPDIVERSQTVSNLPFEGSTTEILRTRFPVRNRPTIGSRVISEVPQVIVSSTENSISEIENLNNKEQFNKNQASIEKTNKNTKPSFGKHSITISTTTAKNEIAEQKFTEKVFQQSRRPGSSLFRNRFRTTTFKTKTADEINTKSDKAEIITTTSRSSLSGFRNRIKINRFKTTPRPSTPAYQNEIDNFEELVPSSTSKKFLISRTRPSFSSRFKTSSTASTESSTEEVTQTILLSEKEEHNDFKELSNTTRKSIMKKGLNRLRSTTSTTESAIDVIHEVTESSETHKLSTQINLVPFKKRLGTSIFRTTKSPQEITKSKDVVRNELKNESPGNKGIFKERRRPLNRYRSTTTSAPEIDESEEESKEDDNSVEENFITNVRSPLPFNISSNSDSVEKIGSTEEVDNGHDVKYGNIERGSQKFKSSKEPLESSTRKYIQINRNRSKINSRFPESLFKNSETENEIESGNSNGEKEHLQQTTRRYTDLNRVRNSASPTDAPVILGNNGYPLGYKPIGRSKAKNIIANSSEETIDINETLNTTTNNDIAHNDTSLELIVINNSNTSFLNKNSNQRFQSKFTRTRTLGSTINTTTNPTPIQVNNALDSENTSTPSSSRRFKVIKLRRPINNNMLINELNNNTSTSTTISQSDDRDRNINISISEVVDNKEKEDSEVHESLQVSELRRPFETLIEKSIRNEEDLVDEIIEIENSATNNNHTESSIINASSKDNSFQYNQSKKSVNASVLEGFEKNSMLTEVHTTEYKENMKTETTFEKIPESETAESNDESHTEISEPLLTKKPFIIKNTIKKLTNLKINENNLEESPVQSYTERQNRPFFPKRSTTVKPYSDETVSDSIVATEEHLVNPHTNRFKRPLIAKKMSATTPSLALLESSSESSDESILTKPGVLNNRTRRPFFPIRRTTTSSPIDIKSVEEEKEEVEKVQVDPQTPKFRKPIIGIRRASTTPKVELLGKTEKTIEEESSETLEVSARRSFLLAKKITSKSHSSGEIGSTKSIVPERVSIRKPFRRPGLSLRLTTEPPQKELYEDNDEVSTSTQRSRFALGGRRTFGSTTSDVDVSQTSTTEVNTSRQPRVFERKFGRTRTSLNTGTNIGLNNAGVGFIDVKTLSLASRGRSSAINRFKSTTEKAEEDISEEDDEDEESNEIINKRPLTIPSGFTRPTIKSNLFANRNKPNIRRPFQSTQKNENETASQDSESEDEEVEEPQRPQNISNLQRPTVRPNVVSFRNRAQAIRRPQPAESEEENISGESEENNDSKGSRLSNFNSKIYEKALPVVTKPTRRTVNNPYAAINRLRSNANNTSSSIRPSAQRPSNRPRVINRPLFGSSTQSSLDQEPSTQNPNSNTRTFKRKFGKFTTTVPSTQAYTKEEILVDALKINELTNIKHSTTTVNPTQLKTSVTETDNTAPTEDYDSTTVIATTLPDSTEDHTEMDEIMIPFQDDSLLKLDSTVDTTTISNEEETTLIDETLTQFQEIINSTASPVTTSTEKETTLQHVFAIPFDERAETTTELIDASTDAKNIAEKTQDIEDEVKKIINMLTGTGAIKPVMYEDVIKEDVVKDTDKTKKDNNEEVANTEKYDENQKVVLSENIEESEKVVTSGKMDIYEQDGLIKEQIEEHVLEKTPKVSDEVELEDKEETHIEEEISVENTNIHSKSNNESEAVSGNEKEITQKKPRTDLKDKIVDITEKIVTLSSSETTIPSSTESNLIKIITGQTIIFFDDDDDDENNFKYTDDFKQREKPILEKINLIDESKTNEENKTRLYSHNKFFTGKKFFPGFRSQENKSTLDTNTTPQSEVVKSIQDKMKSVQEESRSFSKNKIFTQEKNTYKFNKQKTSQPIIEGHYGEVESNEGLSRKESNSIEKQENILNHMIEEIKEVEMRNQEKMDEDNISDEEKKRLTAEKLVEINKIVEVYLKEEKIRFNPKTMEIIRLGEGELKLVRPARTYKLGEISRIKHVSNVQIEGHSSVAGTTISPPSYKQARNIRIVPSEPIRNALPSENNNHGKVFVIPEIVKQMETSTISIEGLFDLNRHGKELNTVYEPESETLTKATTADKPSLPIPLQYVRPLALESDPLVISIANLDQVVLSKLQKDRE
ncbi:Cht6 family protein [Megaselia abdita]